MKRTLNIVAYYRVSTKRQGQSGLGLEAQKSAVLAYATSVGGKIVAEFTEVETGKISDRPQLQEALSRVQMSQAVLVIAKLDRLARNVAFTSALMDSGVEFIACDMPNANRLTIHILAAVAEDEARRISERTKVALAVVKDRGTPLGSSRPNHWDGMTNDGMALRSDRRAVGLVKANLASAESRTAEAIKYAERLKQQIDTLGDDLTYDEIAESLNEQGLVSPRGARITKSLVSKVLARTA